MKTVIGPKRAGKHDERVCQGDLGGSCLLHRKRQEEHGSRCETFSLKDARANKVASQVTVLNTKSPTCLIPWNHFVEEDPGSHGSCPLVTIDMLGHVYAHMQTHTHTRAHVLHKQKKCKKGFL